MTARELGELVELGTVLNGKKGTGPFFIVSIMVLYFNFIEGFLKQQFVFSRFSTIPDSQLPVGKTKPIQLLP
jgi:hypothetical protein